MFEIFIILDKSFLAPLHPEGRQRLHNHPRHLLDKLVLRPFLRLGHATGDLVLKTVAERLQVVIRESDTLARQGGDEFVLLIPQAYDQDGLITLAQKLQEQVELPIPELEGLHLSVSMGIALFPDHAASGEELLHLADTAMYQAKQQRQGSGGHVAIATPGPGDPITSQSPA